jgi:hypothetical protein
MWTAGIVAKALIVSAIAIRVIFAYLLNVGLPAVSLTSGPAHLIRGNSFNSAWAQKPCPPDLKA